MNKTMAMARATAITKKRGARLPATAIALALLLAGCGGGGGSSPSASAPAPTTAAATTVVVPYQTAVANLVNNGFTASFTVSGTIDPSTPTAPAAPVQVSGAGSLVIASATPSTLNGMTLLKATETTSGSVTVNGQSESLATTVTVYYNPSTYTVYAQTNGGVIQLVTPYSIPSTLQAGSTGTFGTVTDNSSTATYAAAADTANSLLVTETETATSNGITTVTQTTYRVSTTGAIGLVSIVSNVSQSGKNIGTLTFKF